MVSSVRTAVVVLSAMSAFALITVAASSRANAEGWVAVAADGKGYWGYAFGKETEEQARAEALQGCGRGDCNVEAAARTRCFAYVKAVPADTGMASASARPKTAFSPRRGADAASERRKEPAGS